MTPRERFIHFVVLFAPPDQRDPLVEEALGLPMGLLQAEHVDDQDDYGAPVLERPMEAAWEFVRYRRYGAPRPYWFPRILPPTRAIL